MLSLNSPGTSISGIAAIGIFFVLSAFIDDLEGDAGTLMLPALPLPRDETEEIDDSFVNFFLFFFLLFFLFCFVIL